MTAMMVRWKALLGSCVIYLAMVPGGDFPSNVWYRVLLDDEPYSTFATWVKASYLVWTLALQALLFLGLTWLFRRFRSWSAALVVLLGLWLLIRFPLTLGAIYLDARLIPSVYRQPDGPARDLPELCRIPHAHLLVSKSSRYASLEGSARAWVLLHNPREPRLLLPEFCRTIPFQPEDGRAALAAAVLPPPMQIAVESRLWYREWFETVPPDYDFKTTSPTYQLQFAPESIHLILGSPPATFRFDTHTVVASGKVVHSTEVEATAEPISFEHFTDKRLITLSAPGFDTVIDASALSGGSVSLLDISMRRRTILLERQYGTRSDVPRGAPTHEYAELDFEGKQRWRIPGAGQSSTLLVNGGDRLTWQASVPWFDPCCTLTWTVAGHPGSHHIARGRNVNSVSLDPAGKFIAVSVSDLHEIGNVPDSVYVFRVSDGAEVFRRFLPPFSHPSVQFLGPDRLAYTDFDGSDGFVRVVQVPGSR